MSMEKMRNEFELAFVEEMVSRCGEGFRSSAWLFFVEKEADGTYSNPTAHAGWWAWQASRESLVIELPTEQPGYMYYAPDVVEAIEAAGLKVTQ